MKIINLGCETRSGLILHFTDPPAPIHGKFTSLPAVGVTSIAPRRTSFGNVSVSRPALGFSPLIVKPSKLVATSDDAAKSSSIRLKGFELREEEFQGEAGQRVDKFGYATLKPH
jgi:hypothetical protein